MRVAASARLLIRATKCLDIRKILAVAPRRALTGAALGIGMRQNVVAVDPVVQSLEAIAGVRLRFRA
jgi:hypothetical protein